MKKLLLAMIGLAIGAMCFAQSLVPVTINGGKNATEIVENTNTTLKFTSKLSQISLAPTIENGDVYSKIAIDGYITNNQIGYPQLPVMVKMIEVPMGAEIVTNVTVNSEKVVSLADAGFNYAIVPCQPSLFKNQKKEDVPFEKNKIYSEGGLYSPETVMVEEAGIMRGIRLVKVIVNPFAYDIADNALTVRDDISVELSFRNADQRSNAIKDSKYSPAFGAMYSKIWNYKQTRNAEMHYPIKYVIVSDRMFEEALQPFIAWKIKKGFNVITAYTDEIGRTESAVKTYMQGLYDAATAEDPAPSYVLYVGDTTQISVQWSKLEHTSGWMGDENDHYTDVYKVCFDGANDYIPDMFFGRFSAQNVSQLTPQIEKTLMFEQYTFPDPSYLEDAVLVAGYDDGSIDDTNGNGQINYATQYYFNDEHNVNATVYLTPASHTSGDAIKAQIGQGVGFVNYSAHCDYDGWQDPSFNLEDIPNLQNESEYFFSIGNCCLSNKFDKDVCFGESLLRTPGKGAVVHIGGTNSTIWNEDFYWSVGSMSTINANPTYEATGQGAYDHLFHERGEAPYVSAGEIVFIGNFAVNSTTSTYIQYYWEIYTLMGDPSLMPYVGVPTQMTPEYSNILPLGSTTLEVTAEDLSYIALSKDGELLDAQYTGNGTSAELTFDALTETGELDLVITRQFRAPYIQRVMVVAGTNENDAAIQSIVAPGSAMSAQEATFQPKITIMNLGTANLTSLTAKYTINDGTPVTTNWTGNLAQYETANITFDEISLETGNYAFAFTVENPNGQVDQDPSNNTKSRNVLVSSGNVLITNVSEPNGNYCGYPQSTPTITVKNASDFVVTSVTASYTCGDLSAEKTFEVSITAGATANLEFDPVEIPEGEGSISFVATMVNGGENQTQTPKTANFNIQSHSGEGFRLSLTADYYGNETSWDIRDENDNIVYSGEAGEYTGSPIITDFCLGAGCYTFNLNDSGGNGLTGYSFWGMTFGEGEASFANLNTNETLLSVDGSESFSTKTVNFCIEDLSENAIEMATEMSIFPNPTSGMLNVTSNEEIDSVEIFNSVGTAVVSNKVAGNNASINMSNLPNGMYFVRVSTANEIETVKVVLER
ncbi:MAG: T9SS type A sorting domain-containing protein [Bacteroidales bacterium]|nr:T9SS type A sorting domain-containing protein [Bacteroidales bacterium]